MAKTSELHEKWSKDPKYREEYDRLGSEFKVVRLLIETRTRAGLTQGATRRKNSDDAIRCGKA